MYKITETNYRNFTVEKHGRYGWFRIGTTYRTRTGAQNIIDYDKEVWRKRVFYVS